ncbi:HNH endonuclease [Niallia taxi]|uniref:HNH endonuclease n=1 Tax=Niallia taxi TaxID=2499688 RepID=UPI003F5E83AB
MPLTFEQKEQIKELRLSGNGYVAIANELKVKRDQVRDYCKRNNLAGELGSKERNIKCLNCGKTATTYNINAKFCSESCRSKYNKRNRGHKQQCKQCNKTFSSYKIQDFCSSDCFRIFQNENKQPKVILTPKLKHKGVCINCNKEHQTRSSNSKFCSYECRYEYKVKQKPINNIKCKECSMWFSTTNNRRKYCSKKCCDKFEDRKKETQRRRRLKKNGKIDWDISVERLIKRDKGACYLCGEQVDIMLNPNHDLYPSIEHVIPVSKGGTHTWDNVKLAHRKCNYLKSNRLI